MNLTLFSIRWRRTVLLAAVSLLAQYLRADTAGTPTEEAARGFGQALQADYYKRHEEAIIARMDSEGLRRRTFRAFGAEALEAANLKELWTNVLWPGITADLRSLSRFRTLMVSRVLLLDGVRALSCVFLDEEGHFQIATFWLESGDNGTPVIVDCRLLGNRLETSRRLRHLFILSGAPDSTGLDDEELTLAIHSDESRLPTQRALRMLSEGHPEDAFRHWSEMPEIIRAQRIWQDLRDQMVESGCKAAQQQMEKEYREGCLTNSLFRYNLAYQSKDAQTRIAAIEPLLEETMHEPFVRVLQADALSQEGRQAEAYRLAREVYELNPLSLYAYAAALRIALQAHLPASGIETLHAWNRLVTLEGIEQVLAMDSVFTNFMKTPEYQAWRRLAPGPIKAPSPL